MGRYIVTAAAVRTGMPPQFARTGTEIELDDEAAETGRWLSLGAIKPSDDASDASTPVAVDRAAVDAAAEAQQVEAAREAAAKAEADAAAKAAAGSTPPPAEASGKPATNEELRKQLTDLNVAFDPKAPKAKLLELLAGAQAAQ